MKNLIWPALMPLHLAAENDLRNTFVEELSYLMTAPDHEFGPSLFALIARMERDFQEEEALMERIDFPDLHNHREQHARLLATLHHLVPKVMAGDYDLARISIEVLPHWLLCHLVKMDAALIAALDGAELYPRHQEMIFQFEMNDYSSPSEVWQ